MKTINYLLVSLLFVSNSIWATSIAVPDFELLDLTLRLTDPAKVAKLKAKEQKKIELMESLIEEGITNSEGFTFIPVSTEARENADKSIGYLFDCAECAADLGRDHNADFILIGRLHKPTYLFSYIIVRIFDVKNNRLIKEYRSEIKGKPSKAIPGAVDNLLLKINRDIPH